MAQFLGWGNGHDGTVPVSGTINSYVSMSGTAGSPTVTTSLTVSAGDMVLLHQSRGTGAGAWELVVVKTPGSGQFTADFNLVYTYTDSGASQAQAVLVPQYTGGTISGTIAGTAWGGDIGGIIALVSNGKLTISGNIDISADGFRGGDSDRQGESYNDQPTVTSEGLGGVANAGGGGGCGSANNQNSGGGGGYGSAGSDGENFVRSGYGGGIYGDATLTSIHLGSGGGGAHLRTAGNGGGIVLIFSKEINTTGSVNAKGSNSDNQTGDTGCAGAGSGGSILIKAQTATLSTNVLDATGGTGGTNPDAGTNGGNGGDGRIRIEACSLTGTTNPSASESIGGQSWCGEVAAIIGG